MLDRVTPIPRSRHTRHDLWGDMEYRAGTCRNDMNARSHTYAETDDGLLPMCSYGWNRSDGMAFSIIRSEIGTEGKCKLCRKNVAAGKPPVKDGFPHPTKWL